MKEVEERNSGSRDAANDGSVSVWVYVCSWMVGPFLSLTSHNNTHTDSRLTRRDSSSQTSLSSHHCVPHPLLAASAAVPSLFQVRPRYGASVRLISCHRTEVQGEPAPDGGQQFVLSVSGSETSVCGYMFLLLGVFKTLGA